jgi:hypothetical protein
VNTSWSAYLARRASGSRDTGGPFLCDAVNWYLGAIRAKIGAMACTKRTFETGMSVDIITTKLVASFYIHVDYIYCLTKNKTYRYDWVGRLNTDSW